MLRLRTSWTDYVVQPVRFEIFEEIGCSSVIDPSDMSPYVFVLPILLPAISALFFCREC